MCNKIAESASDISIFVTAIKGRFAKWRHYENATFSQHCDRREKWNACILRISDLHGNAYLKCIIASQHTVIEQREILTQIRYDSFQKRKLSIDFL